MMDFIMHLLRQILTIILCAQLYACNLTYKVRNQHNDIVEILNFPCGKVTMELIGKGNSKFVFRQKFDVDEKIIVYKDSLKITYNEKQVIFDHHLKNIKSNNGGVEIKENKTWEASFEFESGVFEGDTIKVYGPGYLKCNNEIISLEPMIYSFVNNLRIYGVNDF